MPDKRLFDSEAIEFYKVIKDYAKHEDALVNNRLSWAMGVSSIMILSIAAILADRSSSVKSLLENNSNNHSYETILLLVILLSIVGLITIISCGFGVYAAMTALRSLSEHWDEFEKNHPESIGSIRFPSILGGGHDGNDWLTRAVSFLVRKPFDMGLYYPHFILGAFAIFWSIVICWSCYEYLKLTGMIAIATNSTWLIYS